MTSSKPSSSPFSPHRELLETTCRLANVLKSHGIDKGDRVAIYMPVSPLGVAAMLACARIGAVHSVVFAGFSSEALAGRIQDGESSSTHFHLNLSGLTLHHHHQPSAVTSSFIGCRTLFS